MEQPEASTSAISTFYTVTRAAYPGHRSPHLLTLTSAFPGDGDARRWPRTHSELKLLEPDDSKALLWRSKAGDYLAKELGLYGPDNNQYWMLAALPPGLGLFEQITQKKETQALIVQPGQPDKLRLDRFVWGTGGRKIRSAISLGKHISHHLHQRFPTVCPCDGCKSLAPPPPPLAPGEEPAVIVPPKELTQREKDAKNHRKKPALLVEGPEREPIAPIERPKREIVSRNAGSDSSSSEGRMKSPGETRALYRRTVRWEPEPREEASADVVMDEVQDSPPPIRTDEERMQALERIEVDEDPTAAHEAHLDQVHASDCRRGELVWVAGSCIQGRGSEFGRWPGIVKSKRLEVLTTSNESMQAFYEVELLVNNSIVETPDAIPYLAYIAPDVARLAVKTAAGLKNGRHAITNPEERTTMVALKETTQPEGAIAEYLEAILVAGWYAMIQSRPLPTLETGTHLVTHPKRTKKIITDRKRVVSSKSTADDVVFSQQYFGYDKVWYGAEVLRLGDVVRLHPTIELPACAIRQRTPPNGTDLSMTLCLRVFEFYRAATTNSALFARGQLFEMIEVGPNYVEDTESLDRQPGSKAVDQMTERQAIAALPLPFPLHRWRRITVDGYYVDVFVSGIAGRYYPVDSKLRSATTVQDVTKIINGAIETGVVGYDGFWPLSLMLGGLATAGNIPALTPVHGIDGGPAGMQIAAAERAALGMTLLRRDIEKRSVSERPGYVKSGYMDAPGEAGGSLADQSSA